MAIAADAPAVSPGNGPVAATTARPATEIEGVTILDSAGVAVGCVAHGAAIDVAVDVRFHRDNAAPCFGMEIKSTDDIVLWSATTQFLGLHPAPAGAGERRRYVWRLRANAGGNRYVLAIGVGDVTGGEYRRHSRLHYAGHFDVLPEARSGRGFLEPRIDFVDGVARSA